MLPNNDYIVREPYTNKTQTLHRIRRRKYSPKNLPADNYQSTQWQIDDSIIIPQAEICTLTCEASFGGHLFDIPIVYSDPNARDFDESHTQGLETASFPCAYLHNSSKGQNVETCPVSEPSKVHRSNTKAHCQNQDLETTTDLRIFESFKQTSQSNTDVDSACDLILYPPSRQSDPLRRSKLAILPPRIFRKTNLVILEAA